MDVNEISILKYCTGHTLRGLLIKTGFAGNRGKKAKKKEKKKKRKGKESKREDGEQIRRWVSREAKPKRSKGKVDKTDKMAALTVAVTRVRVAVLGCSWWP
jgi:hypothetical protein